MTPPGGHEKLETLGKSRNKQEKQKRMENIKMKVVTSTAYKNGKTVFSFLLS